ncbi:MAG: hypothetical protein J6B10_00510 [Lachnospiraceae bacterium]|nr:hypothetical protein [Lachnospiraceae bacterium]
MIPGLRYENRSSQGREEETKKEKSFQSILNQTLEKGKEIENCMTQGYTRNGGRCEFVYAKREYHR